MRVNYERLPKYGSPLVTPPLARYVRVRHVEARRGCVTAGRVIVQVVEIRAAVVSMDAKRRSPL